MTFTASSVRSRHNGDGTTTAFPTTFKFILNAHVKAILRSTGDVETTLVETTDYTLAGAGSSSGGTLTMIVAPVSGEVLTIILDVPFTQVKRFPLGGPLPSTQVEEMGDLAAMASAKNDEALDRTLHVPESDSQNDSDLELPIDSDRANKAFHWDSAGKPIAVVPTDASGTIVTATGTLTARNLATRFAEWLDPLDQGARVDGSTNDGAALNLTVDAKGAIEVSYGSSAIGTTITPPANTSIVGNRATELLGLDAIGNGAPLIAPSGNDFSLIGPQITLPVGGSNQLRGIRIRDVNDILVALTRFNAKRLGAWPILLDQAQDGVILLGNILTSIANGIIWKPNLASPTSETYQGQLFIAMANLIRGFDGSSGRIGITIDGNCRGGTIMGNAVENMNGENGSAGFAYAVANDGAAADNMSGICFIGNLAKDINDEAFHQEDQCNGVTYIGNQVIGAKRGIYVINSNDPRNILISHNFLRDCTEQGIYVAGTSKSRNTTIAFNTIEVWGQSGTEKPGILIGQSASLRVKVVGNILCSGFGDGIEVAAGSFVNISNNTIADCTGFGLKIANPTASVLVESNNTLSPADDGPIDTGDDLNGLSGDQTIISPSILWTDASGTVSHVLGHFRRAAVICRAEFIYQDANDSTVERFVQIGFDGGTEILSNGLGVSSDAAFSVKNLTFTSRLIPAGSVLTLNQTTAGDGSFLGRVRVNYFEYD